MASETVFVLLGSNLGDRELLVNQASKMIGERCGKIVAKSRLYESEPWGFKSEHWFLNQVVKVETALSPDDLMKELLEIEKELGRDRSVPHEGYVSRPMDLDILYFGNEIIDTQMVTAPHPRLHERRFTLLPLCDVAPDFVHPVMKKTNLQLLDECQDAGKVNIY
ncbi:MAG: 2-amino-4-hydroxy-6-hydroxymethyldihydropteridine diphosphokinase [Bacteroidales bacterium]|nr:2-amino-4-hydroxy-6-hydroxymethyldihydropteridine diphosphokinase [Bacteroidales bacterium]